MHSSFCQFIVFYCSAPCSVDLDDEVVRMLQARGIQYHIHVGLDGPSHVGYTLASGPYLWASDQLHPVLRVYDDFNGAFFDGIYCPTIDTG